MKHTFKLILSALLAVILIAGCDTKGLHDLNINPNAVNTIDMNYFFTAAELGSASAGSNGDNRFIDWRTNIGMCAHAIQQFATAGTGLLVTGDKYIDNDPEVNNALFLYWYPDVGKNVAEILKETGEGGFEAGKKNNMRQATRMVRALLFQRLTDAYGSVPYSEANKGIDGIFFPHYDKQRAIYTDMLNELDEATAAMTATAAGQDEGFNFADILYNGDITKWKKFGYSLMLRLAMRVSNVDAALATTYINKAITGGVFQSNDDNLIVPMANGPSEWVNQNGISRAMMPGDGGQASLSFLSKTLIDWLKGTNPASTADDDPRLMIFSGGIGVMTASSAGIPSIAPIPGGMDPLNQTGMPNGKDQVMLDADAGHAVDIQLTYSKMNPLLMHDDSPFMLMNYAEVELLQAEAIERNLATISGTAADHYNAGVKAAMQMYTIFDASLSVTDAAVATYLATYPYGGATVDDRLEMIGKQLWASHFMNWYEAWSEWRRTGHPVLIPVNYPGNNTNGQIPTKLRYPANEVSGNPNYKTDATTPDLLTGKVWWGGGPE
jgi:Starch-binding associating with outer membrane